MQIGMVEDQNGVCVPPGQCYCIETDTGALVPPGPVSDTACEYWYVFFLSLMRSLFYCSECVNGSMTCSPKPCNVDCVLSDWSVWGVCSVDCGTGVQTRYRCAIFFYMLTQAFV